MIPFRDNVPARRYPVTTLAIILANLAVFIYELSLPPEYLEALVFQYGVIPMDFQSSVPGSPVFMGALATSLFASMFLHGGWVHLLGNMLYLWVFGDNVEDRMGHGRFLIFYLICGILASALHIYFNPDSRIPSIGASGAVAGVLGAYFVSYPFARVLTVIPLFLFWPIVELPAVLVLGFWFLVQLLNGAAAVVVASETAGGVAWWAHVGGFLAGIILIAVFARRRR